MYCDTDKESKHTRAKIWYFCLSVYMNGQTNIPIIIQILKLFI
jgi:hypothetical protein